MSKEVNNLNDVLYSQQCKLLANSSNQGYGS